MQIISPASNQTNHLLPEERLEELEFEPGYFCSASDYSNLMSPQAECPAFTFRSFSLSSPAVSTGPGWKMPRFLVEQTFCSITKMMQLYTHDQYNNLEWKLPIAINFKVG